MSELITTAEMVVDAEAPHEIDRLDAPEENEVVAADLAPGISGDADEIVDALALPPAPLATFPVADSGRWRPKSWPVRLWHGVWWFGTQIVGWLSLMVGLAIIATIPIVQLISLGYLLETSGRIARTGRLRDGFVDLDKWSRVGSVFLGTWLMLLPLRFLSTWASDAPLVQPDSPFALGLRIVLMMATALMLGHILLAWYSGGKLRDFLWPLLAPFSLAQWLITGKVIGPLVRPTISWAWPSLANDLYQPQPLASWFPPAILIAGLWRGPIRLVAEARDEVWDFVVGLELPHYFWLGLRGFVGSVAWLIAPVSLMIASTRVPNDGLGVLLGLAGFISMSWVLLYLPFLQAHFAAENRLRAIFEVSAVRAGFRKAPLMFVLALLVTLGLAIPPLLEKIQPPYRELFWMLGVVMVALVYPGRLMTGWAVGIGRRREKLAWGKVARWALFRPLAFALCFVYVFILYFSQYTSWFGSSTLLQQHAFLVPTPFLNW